MDLKSHEFKIKSGMTCLSDCGKCCQYPEVSASVLEMLPLAAELVESGNLKNYNVNDNSDRCQFFNQSKKNPDHGFCQEYSNRPVVCRLFGWMSNLDKNQSVHLMTCGPIRLAFPETVNKIMNDEELMSLLPSLSFWSEKFNSLEPSLGRAIYPINQAFKLAVEKILFLKQLVIKSYNQN